MWVSFCSCPGIASLPTDSSKSVTQRLSHYLVPIRDCLGNLELIFDSLVALAPLPQPRHLTFVNKTQQQQQQQQQQQSVSLQATSDSNQSSSLVIKQHSSQYREHRALGVAVEVALALLSTCNSFTSLFTLIPRHSVLCYLPTSGIWVDNRDHCHNDGCYSHFTNKWSSQIRTD
jgi:hypothetical protein